MWPIKIDASQLDQILANLCVNARDAIADAGKIVIETQNLLGQFVLVRVRAIPNELIRVWSANFFFEYENH